jgi:hypothetical protein
MTWNERLTAELRAADERARLLVGDLTPQQLNWKPSADAWSIGQCVEHLCVSNEIYLGPIAEALDGQQPDPVDEIRLGWFSRKFIRDYIAPSDKKAKAPAKIAPGVSAVETGILDRFLRSNDHTRKLMQAASRFDVNRIRFRNPFVPLVRFTVGAGFEIISKHESRHLLQAERVKALNAFPR